MKINEEIVRMLKNKETIPDEYINGDDDIKEEIMKAVMSISPMICGDKTFMIENNTELLDQLLMIGEELGYDVRYETNWIETLHGDDIEWYDFIIK